MQEAKQSVPARVVAAASLVAGGTVEALGIILAWAQPVPEEAQVVGALVQVMRQRGIQGDWPAPCAVRGTTTQQPDHRVLVIQQLLEGLGEPRQEAQR